MSGKVQGIVSGKVLELLEDLGSVPQELKKAVLEQRDQDVLKKWLKLAVKAEIIKEFEDKM